MVSRRDFVLSLQVRAYIQEQPGYLRTVHSEGKERKFMLSSFFRSGIEVECFQSRRQRTTRSPFWNRYASLELLSR